ncbi:ras-related protein Rab-13 [Pocillopora verrucosa]|uniref:ras-related protein Rab-13 n=1 Tax=Pocillopora verrucosa TaxID=203993 RepID=UPI0027971B6B|nr:ras-related protein Rab-13-like [Pocillopora verrucosa]
MALSYHLLFKILLVGDPDVGKCAIFHPPAGDASGLSAMGVNFLKRQLEIDGKRVKLQIWNIAGQESTQAITPSYYHGTQGFIVAFDVTDKSSYDNILEWLLIIEEHASERGSQKMLVANKCHCQERNRVITEKEGEAFAREFGMRYVEINDLQSSEIDEALKQLIQDILNNNGAQEKVEDGRKTNICELDTGYNSTRTGGEKESLLGKRF